MISESLAKKWNSTVDKSLVESVKSLDRGESSNSGEYKEVPCGSYAVSIEKMEIVENKNGNPMFTVWFKIIEGEYKNSRLFWNQPLTGYDFQFHNVNQFLRSLEVDSVEADDIVFTGDFFQYAYLVSSIFDAVDGRMSFDIDYTKNKKGYDVFTVTEVYDN